MFILLEIFFFQWNSVLRLFSFFLQSDSETAIDMCLCCNFVYKIPYFLHFYSSVDKHSDSILCIHLWTHLLSKWLRKIFIVSSNSNRSFVYGNFEGMHEPRKTMKPQNDSISFKLSAFPTIPMIQCNQSHIFAHSFKKCICFIAFKKKNSCFRTLFTFINIISIDVTHFITFDIR